MFERLSDKDIAPAMEEFITHIGSCKGFFHEIDNFLTNDLLAEKAIRFSRDKSISGWGIKYNRKSKYFCDIITEADAFTVMLRLSDEQIKTAYNEVLPYSKECLDSCHQTNNGGWVQYRVLNEENLSDVKKILDIRNK